jgi:hypothetical protein
MERPVVPYLCQTQGSLLSPQLIDCLSLGQLLVYNSADCCESIAHLRHGGSLLIKQSSSESA